MFEGGSFTSGRKGRRGPFCRQLRAKIKPLDRPDQDNRTERGKKRSKGRRDSHRKVAREKEEKNAISVLEQVRRSMGLLEHRR